MSVDFQKLEPLWFVEGYAGGYEGAIFRDQDEFRAAVGPYSTMFGVAQDSSVSAFQARIKPCAIRCSLPKMPTIQGNKLEKKRPRVFGSATLVASLRAPSVLSVSGAIGAAEWIDAPHSSQEGKPSHLPWEEMLLHPGLCVAERGQRIGAEENYCRYYAGKPIHYRNQILEETHKSEILDLYSLVADKRRDILSLMPKRSKSAPKLSLTSPALRVTGIFRIIDDEQDNMKDVSVVLAPDFTNAGTQHLAFFGSVPKAFLDGADTSDVLPGIVDQISSHLWLYSSLIKLNTSLLRQIMAGKKNTDKSLKKLHVQAREWLVLAEPSWDIFGFDGQGYRLLRSIIKRLALQEKWMENLSRLSRLTNL